MYFNYSYQYSIFIVNPVDIPEVIVIYFDSDLFSTAYIIINKEQKSALYKVVGEVAVN